MKKHIPITLRIIVAVILIQTLRFKFTAHPDSVYIFEKVGMEPIGRIAIGILELLAGIFLLFRKTVSIGALIAIGVLGGAILLHLTKLGIEINNDSGILFYTAITTFLLAIAILLIYRKDFSLSFGKKSMH